MKLISAQLCSWKIGRKHTRWEKDFIFVSNYKEYDRNKHAYIQWDCNYYFKRVVFKDRKDWKKVEPPCERLASLGLMWENGGSSLNSPCTSTVIIRRVSGRPLCRETGVSRNFPNGWSKLLGDVLTRSRYLLMVYIISPLVMVVM